MELDRRLTIEGTYSYSGSGNDETLATLLTRAGYSRTTCYFTTPARDRRFRGNARMIYLSRKAQVTWASPSNTRRGIGKRRCS